MTWEELDWPALDRLREGFLRGGATGPYWTSAADLASYDLTYGERIGWKWDAVFRELRLRRWRPEPGLDVLDWGCGSGVASRRLLSFLGPDSVPALRLWDHAPLATGFAVDAARAAFPGVAVSPATPDFLASDAPVGVLVLSHVLNELTPDAFAEVRRLLGRAQAVLWCEPGTHEVSRRLGALRDELRDTFDIAAPCTHGGACPALAPDRERDWCHFFAPPPSEIFADPRWVNFGQRAGIDLRSLPYSFLALSRRTPNGDTPAPAVTDAGLSRIIGRPEHFKPYARFLSCDASGLTELTLPRRANPALCKALERSKAPLVYRWRREGPTVIGGEPLPAPDKEHGPDGCTPIETAGG